MFYYVVKAEIIDGVTDLSEIETNPVKFTCRATGEPVPSISWYFNNAVINLSDTSKYYVSNSSNQSVFTSSLTILNVQSSDAGTYSCRASNIIGSDQSSGLLTVNSK